MSETLFAIFLTMVSPAGEDLIKEFECQESYHECWQVARAHEIDHSQNGYDVRKKEVKIKK